MKTLTKKCLMFLVLSAGSMSQAGGLICQGLDAGHNPLPLIVQVTFGQGSDTTMISTPSGQKSFVSNYTPFQAQGKIAYIAHFEQFASVILFSGIEGIHGGKVHLNVNSMTYDLSCKAQNAVALECTHPAPPPSDPEPIPPPPHQGPHRI
jgi:hypothetical protein